MGRVGMVLGLAAVGALLVGGCSRHPQCKPRSAVVEIPCSVSRNIDHVETDGAACGSTTVEPGDPGSVLVDPAGEGTCRFTIVLRSGERYELTAVFHANVDEACSAYWGEITSPIPQFCPDAGPCAGQTGCFVDPAMTYDPKFAVGLCSLLCVPESGRSCSTKVMGARAGECDEFCVCGGAGYSFVDGCKTDSDCAITRADCCGCERGGTSFAVLASHKDKWEYNVCHGAKDRGAEACTSENRCDPAAHAVCDDGRCVMALPDGGN